MSPPSATLILGDTTAGRIMIASACGSAPSASARPSAQAPVDATQMRGELALSPTNLTTEDESDCAGSKCLTLTSTPSTAAIEIDPSPHGATPKQQLLIYSTQGGTLATRPAPSVPPSLPPARMSYFQDSRPRVRTS